MLTVQSRAVGFHTKMVVQIRLSDMVPCTWFHSGSEGILAKIVAKASIVSKADNKEILSPRSQQ